MKLLQQLLLQRRFYISCLCSKQLLCNPLPHIHQTAQNRCMSQHSISQEVRFMVGMSMPHAGCTEMLYPIDKVHAVTIHHEFSTTAASFELKVVWSGSWHNLVRMRAKADRAAWLTIGRAARTHSSVTAVWLGSSRSRRDTASSPVRLTVTCNQPTLLCTTTTCYYYSLLLVLLITTTTACYYKQQHQTQNHSVLGIKMLAPHADSHYAHQQGHARCGWLRMPKDMCTRRKKVYGQTICKKQHATAVRSREARQGGPGRQQWLLPRHGCPAQQAAQHLPHQRPGPSS